MPVRRHTARRPMGRAQRRKLIWAQRQTTTSFSANGQWTVLDLLQTYKAHVGASSAGITIMRTHLWVLPHSPAAGDLWWMGLRVGDNDELATNTTNALVPNPRDNPYVDWAFASQFEHDNSTFLPMSPMHTTGAAAVLDLRAKRRLEELDQAWTLTILQDTVGTVAKQYDVFARILLALP